MGHPEWVLGDWPWFPGLESLSPMHRPVDAGNLICICGQAPFNPEGSFYMAEPFQIP
jgi:enamine deaminase RidA (YjgF/YER057c/UK114 family)